MANPFVTYHPAATVDRGRTTPRQAGRKATCSFRTRGFSCGCERCEARISERQLDLLTQQATAAVRTFGRNGQKGGAR